MMHSISVRFACFILLLLSSLLSVGADPASPMLSQVVLLPAAADAPPSFSGMVTGGPPGGTAWLQASLDMGVTDPWVNIATTGLDHLGSTTFTNISDPRVQPLVSQRHFFRVLASAAPIEEFSLIPAGSFTMGRTSGDDMPDAPPVTVSVSAFYMAKHETTKELWDEVRAWGLNHGYTDLAVGNGTYASKGANHPVHTVDWYDLVKWCNARSEKEGLVAVYRNSDDTVFKTGGTAPTPDWGANGYRLPTEAEWEKAAHGGISGKRFPWGTDTISQSQANYIVYSSNGVTNYFSYDVTPRPPATDYSFYHPTYATGKWPYSAPVASFAPNGYGLYDMCGNASEWCWDRYGTFIYEDGVTDPRGAEAWLGTTRVIRGGGWNVNASYCRSAVRGSANPTYTHPSVGFRVARSSLQ